MLWDLRVVQPEIQLSLRKLHPVLRVERATKGRFTTRRKIFFERLMNVILGVVKSIL